MYLKDLVQGVVSIYKRTDPSFQEPSGVSHGLRQLCFGADSILKRSDTFCSKSQRHEKFFRLEALERLCDKSSAILLRA